MVLYVIMCSLHCLSFLMLITLQKCFQLLLKALPSSTLIPYCLPIFLAKQSFHFTCCLFALPSSSLHLSRWNILLPFARLDLLRILHAPEHFSLRSLSPAWGKTYQTRVASDYSCAGSHQNLPAKRLRTNFELFPLPTNTLYFATAAR